MNTTEPAGMTVETSLEKQGFVYCLERIEGARDNPLRAKMQAYLKEFLQHMLYHLLATAGGNWHGKVVFDRTASQDDVMTVEGFYWPADRPEPVQCLDRGQLLNVNTPEGWRPQPNCVALMAAP